MVLVLSTCLVRPIPCGKPVAGEGEGRRRLSPGTGPAPSA